MLLILRLMLTFCMSSLRGRWMMRSQVEEGDMCSQEDFKPYNSFKSVLQQRELAVHKVINTPPSSHFLVSYTHPIFMVSSSSTTTIFTVTQHSYHYDYPSKSLHQVSLGQFSAVALASPTDELSPEFSPPPESSPVHPPTTIISPSDLPAQLYANPKLYALL